MIVVDEPGPLALIQDEGRRGLASVGVTPSGAYDQQAADLANRLVGNESGAAVIEALGSGLRLRTDHDILVAVTGAAGGVVVSGRVVPRNTGLHLPAHCVIELKAPTAGVRSYVAVRGGIAVPRVLGSRSRDTLGQIGPDPLQIGDWLPVGPPTAPAPPVAHAPAPAPQPSGVRPLLRITPGPRRDWFDDTAWDILTTAPWQVAPSSNRVGVRLLGPSVPRVPRRQGVELPPEGLVRGAIQVPLMDTRS